MHSFVLKRKIPLPELQCTLYELEHEPSQAKVLHIENDDPENVFCIAFRTTPDSSNGVAHILEHTVLCGSKRFPVKDPFFAMNRRSLNTFMNAFTGSDFTCYPAATQIPKDFYNLLDVYLDAVFQPILNPLSFKQEGWRLEFEGDTLTYKGIVYNEMKGALSSPMDRLRESINQALFPSITYGFNSGGDPKEIPHLTYDEFLEFYNHAYHPSRALFFFYGNIPLEKHLEFIEEKVLKNVPPLSPLSPLPHQKRYEKPIVVKEEYPLSPGDDPQGKTMMALAWLTCPVTNQADVLALTLIDSILMDTDASPLKKALLQSGLCKQAGSYVEVDISEIPFVIVLQGMEEEDTEQAETFILNTLQTIAKEGFSEKQINTALHQLEIQRKEITGSGHPYGLSLFFRSALFKMHGGSPEYGLLIHSLFETVRKNLKENPRYLEECLLHYCLNNAHRIRVDFIPSTSLQEKEIEEETKKLETIRSSLSPHDIKAIKQEAEKLSLFQEEQEKLDDSILPSVTLEDVPKTGQRFHLQKATIPSGTLYHHETFTNGLIYADLVFPLHHIPELLLPYLPLFNSFLTQVGAGGRTYEENLDYIEAYTGGIGATTTFHNQASDSSLFFPSFVLGGKALNRNQSALFSLFHDTLNTADFSSLPRLQELLLKKATSLETNLTQMAMKYATNLSGGYINSTCRLSQIFSGLDHFHFVKKLASLGEKGIEELQNAFIQLQKLLLSSSSLDCVLTADKEAFAAFKPPSNLIKPSKEIPFAPPAPTVSLREGRIIASPVAFTAQMLRSLPYTHPDAPLLNIAAYIFCNETLHPKIREQGGAYGGGASCSSIGGTFHFYAYRDPHLASTLSAFRESVEVVARNKVDESRLDEAKLEIIQGLDTPVSPGSRGDTAYEWLRQGRTDDMRQAYRERLLSATLPQVAKAVEEHLLPQWETSSIVSFAGKELLEKENKKLKNLLTLRVIE